MQPQVFIFVNLMACVTLLSDFGLQDASVASCKGILMQHIPKIEIVDISHEVTPYHLQQASYLLNAAYKNFEKGSFHIVLCNLYSQANPKLLLCSKNGHYFIAPDNGILSLAFNGIYDDVWDCYHLNNDENIRDWMAKTGEIIQSIQGGMNPAQSEYKPCQMSNTLTHWTAQLVGNTVECHVIHIDRYENVVVNITKEQFESFRQGRNFAINFVRETITEISNSYANVRKGEMLCRFNSAGYLEIAINQDRAATLLGLKLNKEQHLIYNSIKIVFR
ncbi:MAG: SAM-dependent chlorinase/fluorinase [Bacteroidetes bacterium]|nr:SAM-dependent chlorinase/fluorinase [Bacteroidota bacterium]